MQQPLKNPLTCSHPMPSLTFLFTYMYAGFCAACTCYLLVNAFLTSVSKLSCQYLSLSQTSATLWKKSPTLAKTSKSILLFLQDYHRNANENILKLQWV